MSAGEAIVLAGAHFVLRYSLFEFAALHKPGFGKWIAPQVSALLKEIK
jgi:hypothetical protein